MCITRARAQCARQPRGSPESPCASSNGRARVILAQRVAPEPCAQLQETCANAARRFGQIDGETSARRMIGDGSSHAPTARSERGAASERTSSRTRRRAHGLLTRTMPPGSGGSPYLIILELHGRGPHLRRLFGAAPSSEGGEKIVLEREEREKERKRKGKRKEKERKERKEKEKERKGKKRGKRKGKDHVKKKRKEEEGWSKRRKREGKRKRRKERSESAERVFRVLRQLLRRQIAVHLGHVHLRGHARDWPRASFAT